MSKFQDAMNDFSNTPDLPEGLLSTLTNAYTEDFSSYEAKVSGMENELASKDDAMTQQNTDYSAQISSLKSANYDLLRAVPKDAKASSSDNREDDLSDRGITIADLFGKKS